MSTNKHPVLDATEDKINIQLNENTIYLWSSHPDVILGLIEDQDNLKNYFLLFFMNSYNYLEIYDKYLLLNESRSSKKEILEPLYLTKMFILIQKARSNYLTKRYVNSFFGKILMEMIHKWKQHQLKYVIDYCNEEHKSTPKFREYFCELLSYKFRLMQIGVTEEGLANRLNIWKILKDLKLESRGPFERKTIFSIFQNDNKKGNMELFLQNFGVDVASEYVKYEVKDSLNRTTSLFDQCLLSENPSHLRFFFGVAKNNDFILNNIWGNDRYYQIVNSPKCHYIFWNPFISRSLFSDLTSKKIQATQGKFREEISKAFIILENRFSEFPDFIKHCLISPRLQTKSKKKQKNQTGNIILMLSRRCFRCHVYVFCLVVLFSDGFLKIKTDISEFDDFVDFKAVKRFLKLMKKLPLELQRNVCIRIYFPTLDEASKPENDRFFKLNEKDILNKDISPSMFDECLKILLRYSVF